MACLAVPIFFPHYVINGTIFGENLWNIKCVFDLLYNFVSKSSNSEKNSGRYYKFTQIGQVKHSLVLSRFNDT